MLESNWYYIKPGMLNDEQVGPIPSRQIIHIAKTGEIDPQTKVASPEYTRNAWRLLGDVPELLAAYQEGEALRQRKEAREAAERAEEKRRKQAEKEAQREASRLRRDAEAAQRLQAELAEAERKRNTFQPRSYPALEFYRSSLRSTAAVIVGLAALMCFLFLFAAFGGLIEGILGIVLIVIVCGPLVLGLLITAEAIKVILDIQRNTQESAFASRQLIGRQESQGA